VACSERSVSLRRLILGDELAFMAALRDWPENEREWFTWHWEQGAPFQAVLEKIERESSGEGIPAHLVPATMYYGFVGKEIIGRLHLRHRLNDALLIRGGHIGYSVAPRHRNQGFASAMLQQGLIYASKLKIQSALLTCADSNTASWRVIEKFGGKLETIFVDSKNGERVRKYWIETSVASGLGT
jgi:predicted acetyltransferase